MARTLWLGLCVSLCATSTFGQAPGGASPVEVDTPKDIQQAINALLPKLVEARPEECQALEAELLALGVEAAPHVASVAFSLRGTPAVPTLARVLGGLGGDAACEGLLRLFASESASDRRAALEGLSGMRHTKAALAFVRAVGDGDPRVAALARRTLLSPEWRSADLGVESLLIGELRSARAPGPYALLLGQLQSALGHRALRDLLERGAEANTQVALLQGVLAYGRRDDVSWLFGMARDLAPRARELVCVLAGRVADVGAIPDLIRCLRDPDPSVAASAHRSLRRVSGKTFDPHPDLWEKWWMTTKDPGSRLR